MDLRIKLFTLPFTDFEFYKKEKNELNDKLQDKLEILASKPPKKSKKKSDDNYTDYFDKKFVPIVYKILNRTQKVTQLDEIDLLLKKYYPENKLRDSYYRYGENNTKFYLYHLTKLSKYLLTHKNGKIALKYWKSDGEENILGPYKGIYKIALWNSLNRLFTTDLLVMLYLIDNGMTDECYLSCYHALVDVADLQLDQILEEGVAENHLHMNAGINFIVSWTELMSLSRTREEEKELLMQQDQTLGKDLDINPYVKAMAVIRLLLAHYLSYYETYEVRNKTLKDYYCCDGKNEEDEIIWNFLNAIYLGVELKGCDKQIVEIYNNLKFKWNISEKVDSSDLRWKEILARKDVIHTILKSYGTYTNVENVFLFKALKYMKERCNDELNNDEFFSRIFWQYIIIKNEAFQLKVQGNKIKGLKSFVEYYKRSTESALNKKEYLGYILHTQLNNKNLKKLELRYKIPGKNSKREKKNQTKKFLKNFFEVYKGFLEEMQNEKNIDIEEHGQYLEGPFIGIVFHFIKELDAYQHEKCWLEYKEYKEATYLNYRKLQKQYEQEIEVINELRHEIKGLSKYIVGIDAASIENDTEPWVFAPIYERARNSDTYKLFHKNSNQPIRNLGFTFHVGEDFRHILTGLRRIDEVIDYFKFHAGDRIGHGIALGVKPEKWINNNKVVILPRIEHLENLLWIWGIYKDGRYSKDFDTAYLEQEIMFYAEKIYNKMQGITTYNLWKAYQNKFKIINHYDKYQACFDRIHKNELFCPFAQSVNGNKAISNITVSEGIYLWDEDKLTLVQHCKCYLEKMNEPIEIEVRNQDLKMYENIQKIVAHKVAKNGIIIEANPTSNTAIGEVDSILEHYICNLNQRGLTEERKAENGIIVTINSDDPSVFNTNVNNEFGYIFYALQEKGYSREDILNWIDKIRKHGLRTSFVPKEKTTYRNKIKEIEDIIKSLKD
jgi:adenosine deaminase